MSRKKLLWQVYPYYLIIIVGALVSAALYASGQMREAYQREITMRLEAVAILTADQLNPEFFNESNPEIDVLSKRAGKNTQSRITIVNTDGKVLGDSDADPVKMENHKNRPEIVLAFGGETAVVTRFSNTLQQKMIFVAVPIEHNGTIIGVVRNGVPASTINSAMASFNERMIWSGVIITMLATLISLVIFRKLSRPLVDLKQGAERFAQGDFKTKIAVPQNEEIGALADSMNLMAEQLNERIGTIVKQGSEQQALLASMIEGVLAVDADERIISINLAAAKLYDIEPVSALGKSVYEIIRHAELHDFIQATLSSSSPLEKELIIQTESFKILQAHGSVMHDAEGELVGAVIVLNDVTSMKKLENIRRDFVANVSHELKTPITSIKGFVETLIDGALENPEEARRFLNIIVKQADRLNSIVDDLLTLSRIEREFEKQEIELRPLPLWDILTAAVQVCEPAARTNGIQINLGGDKAIVADINKRQLEQALINLIENAVKYSGSNSQVHIKVDSDNREIRIAVIDEGSGIDKKHLPRIFERFYRVDQARSRDAGGTGLGLAIVKHIVIAHGGSVSVESTPGQGSVFTIHLPERKN